MMMVDSDDQIFPIMTTMVLAKVSGSIIFTVWLLKVMMDKFFDYTIIIETWINQYH